MGKRKREDAQAVVPQTLAKAPVVQAVQASKPAPVEHKKKEIVVVEDEDVEENPFDKEMGASSSVAVQDDLSLLNPPKLPKIVNQSWKNRQRTLIISSRGVSARGRHLMLDLRAMMPHSKKDTKLDGKDKPGEVLPEICDLRNCNNCVYYEMRKKKDLYMWIAKLPNGPSVKFLVENLGTMEELRYTGNCLKGSRAILDFDSAFDKEPHLMVIKELLFQTFGVARNHPKSKPFVDHMISFFFLDNRVWMRHYQVSWKLQKEHQEMELTEIGPRFVLNPIRVFSGAFSGATLYQNSEYISPNEVRSHVKYQAGMKKKERMISKHESKARQAKLVIPKDEVGEIFEDDSDDQEEDGEEDDDE